jgi:hypothetical protein
MKVRLTFLGRLRRTWMKLNDIFEVRREDGKAGVGVS